MEVVIHADVSENRLPETKKTLVASIYPGQHPQCPSLSPHVLLVKNDLPHNLERGTQFPMFSKLLKSRLVHTLTLTKTQILNFSCTASSSITRFSVTKVFHTNLFVKTLRVQSAKLRNVQRNYLPLKLLK